MPHEVVHVAHHVRDVGAVVPEVDPEEIDVVHAEALQAPLDRLHHALLVVASGVGMVPDAWVEAAVQGVGVLRRHDVAMALGGDELPQNPLAEPPL